MTQPNLVLTARENSCPLKWHSPTAHNPAAFRDAFKGRLDWTNEDLMVWGRSMAEACIEADAVLHDPVFKITPEGETEQAAKGRAFDEKFWITAGKKAFRRAHTVYAQHCKSVGGQTGQNYVSKAVFEAHIEDKAQQQKWLDKSTILDKATRSTTIKLSAVIKIPEQAYAKLYVMMNGLNAVAEEMGYSWFMATITLPGHYHANPSMGHNSWSGASVAEGWGGYASDERGSPEPRHTQNRHPL